MTSYVEALIALLPEEAGGRSLLIAPRDGSYRPLARSCDSGALFRLRIIEGPPRIAPGDQATVVAELECDVVEAGGDIDLLDRDQRVVGVLTVMRVCGREVAV